MPFIFHYAHDAPLILLSIEGIIMVNLWYKYKKWSAVSWASNDGEIRGLELTKYRMVILDHLRSKNNHSYIVPRFSLDWHVQKMTKKTKSEKKRSAWSFSASKQHCCSSPRYFKRPRAATDHMPMVSHR